MSDASCLLSAAIRHVEVKKQQPQADLRVLLRIPRSAVCDQPLRAQGAQHGSDECHENLLASFIATASVHSVLEAAGSDCSC